MRAVNRLTGISTKCKLTTSFSGWESCWNDHSTIDYILTFPPPNEMQTGFLDDRLLLTNAANDSHAWRQKYYLALYIKTMRKLWGKKHGLYRCTNMQDWSSREKILQPEHESKRVWKAVAPRLKARGPPVPMSASFLLPRLLMPLPQASAAGREGTLPHRKYRVLTG